MLRARAVSSQVRSGRSAASMSDAATAAPSSAESPYPYGWPCRTRFAQERPEAFVTISQA